MRPVICEWFILSAWVLQISINFTSHNLVVKLKNANVWLLDLNTSILFLSRGSKIFPSFVKFLKSKDNTDGSEDALVAELTALDEYLKENVS